MECRKRDHEGGTGRIRKKIPLYSQKSRYSRLLGFFEWIHCPKFILGIFSFCILIYHDIGTYEMIQYEYTEIEKKEFLRMQKNEKI